MGRPSVVVRGDRDFLCANLSSWFIGNFSKERAESQCRRCILGIVDPYPVDCITSQDFDLFLTTSQLPSSSSALKCPADIFEPAE